MARPVLVVEDHADVREGIVSLLEAHGYATLAAENGAQAIEVARGAPEPPGLILLDVQMPVMDAVAFRRKVMREYPQLARIPVAVITALPYDARVMREFRGAIYLGKPFDPDKLIELVARHWVPQ